MNDPEAMTLEEAAETLGISREAGAPQVERAYAEKLEALEKKIAVAPTAALKNKYRNAMDRLKLARETMEKQDDGCDLPSLEISEVPTSASRMAPVADPTPVEPTASAPVPATPPVPAAPRKPLPIKAIGIGLAALLLIVLGVVLLRDPATAVYAGDFTKRINYETVVYDFSLSVAKNGTITGTSQVADKSSKPVNITGKVNETGALTATADDKSTFTGQIKGEEMELEEKLESAKTLVFSLKKGGKLPTDAPQAQWAGVYHNPSIEYPAGKYEMRFEVASNGDISASSRKLSVKEGAGFQGRVNTKGKVSATWVLGNGEKVNYAGSVADGEMILTETLATGSVFNIKLTKGEKKSINLSPHAGAYRNRINYTTVVYDFDFNVSEAGAIQGTSRIADASAAAITITGTVNDEGKVSAKASDSTPYTGTIKDGEMTLTETVKGKDFTFSLIKGKALPTKPPQAAFAGTYSELSVIDPNGAAYEYEFTVSAEGKLTGSYTSANGGTRINITGRVGTKGVITAEGAVFTDGLKNTYTGTVTERGLEITETMRNGKSFSFVVPKS